MPKLEEVSKHGDSSEPIVNLLYNTGYRLTGSHRKTQELLKGVFNALNGNIDFNIALKNLCLIYRNKTTSSPGKNLPQEKNSSSIKVKNTEKIQTALLTLPPAERVNIGFARDIRIKLCRNSRVYRHGKNGCNPAVEYRTVDFTKTPCPGPGSKKIT